MVMTIQAWSLKVRARQTDRQDDRRPCGRVVAVVEVVAAAACGRLRGDFPFAFGNSNEPQQQAKHWQIEGLAKFSNKASVCLIVLSFLHTYLIGRIVEYHGKKLKPKALGISPCHFTNRGCLCYSNGRSRQRHVSKLCRLSSTPPHNSRNLLAKF